MALLKTRSLFLNSKEVSSLIPMNAIENKSFLIYENKDTNVFILGLKTRIVVDLLLFHRIYNQEK